MRYRSPILAALLLTLVVGAPAPAQEPNTTGSLTLNGIETGFYPIDAPLLTPSTLTFQISGSPTSAWQPFALFLANDVMPAGVPVGSEFVDIDISSIQVVLDGTNPSATPLNYFAFMDGSSSALLALPTTPQAASPILVGGFQALIFDPSAPFGFELTAATRLTLLPPPTFPTLHYSRGLGTGNHAAYSMVAPVNPIPNGGMPSDFDIETLYLAGFQPYSSTSGTHPWWRKDFASLPAGTTAMRVYENTSFSYIKTKHGDLYLYQDNGANAYGFALSSAAGLNPLLSTVIPATSTVTEIEVEVEVHENRLAYVIDPSSTAPSPNDRMMLASLDGPNLAGGVDLVDITPTSPGITAALEESLTFTTSNLFFVGHLASTSSSTGNVMYSAPSDGSAIGAQVAIPTILDPMGMPVIPTYIDAEMRHSEDHSMFVFQAGTAATNEDLYAILDGGPGVYAPINLTSFATPTEIEEFGDDASGADNQVAISPNNVRVAFVTLESGSDELYIVGVAAPGTLTHVSGPANMDPLWTETIELHWATDDTLVFWAGTNTSTGLELCSYTVSTGVFQNLTQTNGSATLPAAGVPTIDVDNIFYSPSRSHLFWSRDNGTDGLGNNASNWIALDLATLALTDITGNEFAGGTAPHCDDLIIGIQYARNSDVVIFGADDATSAEQNVYAFTAGPAPTAAIRLTNNLGTTSNVIDNISVNDSGSNVAFGDSISGQELLYRADTTVANSATVVYTPPAAVINGNLTDGSIRWTGLDQFVFAYGTTSTSNPLDALLFLHDGTLGNLILDTTLATYWIY